MHVTRGHKKTNEASEMPHICKYCKKDVVGAENFKIHENFHLNNTCQNCGKNFLVANKLKRHFQKCHKIHENLSAEVIQNNPSSYKTSTLFPDFENSQKIHENYVADVIYNYPSSSKTSEESTVPDVLYSQISFCHFW